MGFGLEFPQPLSNSRIETARSGKCPISAVTDASGHVVLEGLQTGVYGLTIPVEPCGVNLFCAIEVESGGRWNKLSECEPLPASARSLAAFATRVHAP